MFTTHSASVTAISVDAVMLPCRLIILLPPPLPHSSHIKAIIRLHGRCLAGPPGWFCNVVCLLLRFPSKQNAKVVQSLQSLCLYSGCSGLSRISAEPDPGSPWKTTATAFEVICGWSVADTVFYYVIITARRRPSVDHLLVTDLPQLDQLTWCTCRHLTQRLRAITVGALWGRDVDNFCVWIITNCRPNYLNEKNNFISDKK